MSVNLLSMLAAFGAGVLSFLSPCVLPLMPGYLSYLAGVSLEEVQSQAGARWRVSQQALWFVLGCALLLTLLGVLAALVGHVLNTYQQVLSRLGGLLLILFGITLTRLLPVPWFSRDHRIEVKPGRSAWWRSGLIGIAFGASWSACAGPLLGAILVLTAVGSQLVLQGALARDAGLCRGPGGAIAAGRPPGGSGRHVPAPHPARYGAPLFHRRRAPHPNGNHSPHRPV